MNTKPKILLIDIETSPNLAYVWGMYEQNVIGLKESWQILCFSAKWLDQREVVAFSKEYSTNDKKVTKKIWSLLNEADIVIAHNGDKFDLRKINARFSFWGINPPSPYKTIDTLKIARKYFAFNGNNLNALAVHLGLGKKIKTGGFDLWLGCMMGDEVAWRKMVRYNKMDVRLLERVYLHFRPWITNHPNISLYLQDEVCPKCGSKHLQSRGFAVTILAKYRRFQCQDCGGWGRMISREKRTHKQLTNVR